METGKLTAQLLQQAMKKVLADMEKHKKNPQLHHGKQTLRQLMKHNTGVSNIEITDQNIKAFSATAKKYGIDFALKKDTTGEIQMCIRDRVDTPAASSTASQTAAAAAKVTSGSSSACTAGRSSTLIYSPVPGGEKKARPIRPRPARCV